MRILVVDDNEQLLHVTKHMLKFYNHEVVIDLDSNNTLKLFKKDPNSFDILFTDQCMPYSINGTDLINKILLIKPDMCCIITSGYLTDSLLTIINQYKSSRCAVEFLAKPFSMIDLKDTIIKVTRRLTK